ncbi:MAG: sigma 54-interacting transcriptional regulator [Clostridium sp.]
MRKASTTPVPAKPSLCGDQLLGTPGKPSESELFGYVEGAFTGASKGGKMGFFELAHKGTIFLDEIGDVSPNLQSRLLRVLQEREVVRLGSDIPSFRLMCALSLPPTKT